MKRYLPFLAVIAFIIACTPEGNYSSDWGQINPNELIVTGDVLSVTDYTAMLTGYANLPLELGNAEVGVMYDTNQSFQNAEKVVAVKLDENHRFTVSITRLLPKTKYYYKSYVKNGMAMKYGEIKSFTTSIISVEGIILGKQEYLFNSIGGKLSMSVTILPENATNKSVEWSTDREDVVNIDTFSGGVTITAKANGKATVTATTEDQRKTATCVITVAQYVESFSIDKTLLGLAIGEDTLLSITGLKPDNALDKTVSWSSSDNAIASVDNSGRVTGKSKGEVIIKATANDGSRVSASCHIYVIEGKVDMGIKTSDGKTLYWSTRNLCDGGFVNTPMDFGDYYAWGETESKSEYTTHNYKWYNGYNMSIAKYNTNSSYGAVDNKTVLELEDDVAHIKLGGNWRIPTGSEWEKLRTNCTWEHVFDYRDYNSQEAVDGVIVTASNGNSIFLPLALSGTNPDYPDGYPDTGTYWSSSLNPDNPYWAKAMYFNSYTYSISYCEDVRCSGLSVRPVTE